MVKLYEVSMGAQLYMLVLLIISLTIVAMLYIGYAHLTCYVVDPLLKYVTNILCCIPPSNIYIIYLNEKWFKSLLEQLIS